MALVEHGHALGKVVIDLTHRTASGDGDGEHDRLNA